MITRISARVLEASSHIGDDGTIDDIVSIRVNDIGGALIRFHADQPKYSEFRSRIGKTVWLTIEDG